MEVRIDSRSLRKAIQGAIEAVRKPPMKDVATILSQGVRDAFRNETDPWGAPWPPHSPLTLKARRRKGNASRQKLLDTGRLYASIRDDYTDIEASISVGAGLPDPRATVNQFGTTSAGRSRRVVIPPRPFFPMRDERTVSLPDEWKRRIDEALARHIEKKSEAA